MTPTKENIRQNIIYLRSKSGCTQEAFSQKLNIKRSLLGAYEEGRATPKVETLLLLAKLFTIKVDDIVKGRLLGKLRNLVK